MAADGLGLPSRDIGSGRSGVPASWPDPGHTRDPLDLRTAPAHRCPLPRALRLEDVGMWFCPACGQPWRMEAVRPRNLGGSPVIRWVQDPYEQPGRDRPHA